VLDGLADNSRELRFLAIAEGVDVAGERKCALKRLPVAPRPSQPYEGCRPTSDAEYSANHQQENTPPHRRCISPAAVPASTLTNKGKSICRRILRASAGLMQRHSASSVGPVTALHSAACRL